MAEKKVTTYVAVHQLEGSKDQFAVSGAKTGTVTPGTEFQTDDKTAAELLACGACRSLADAPVVKAPVEAVSVTSDKDDTGL